ncbi:MAG: hypothetical protein JWQ25_1892 [Daejeonella sp.]|nr:hypothetical protein [Daejeonella sp.]
MEEKEMICEELLALASRNIAEIEEMIPEDPVSCFAFFVEASRVYDSWALSAEFLSWEESCSQQYLDLLGLGYNLLTFYFFKKVPMQGFPIVESTDKSRKFAITILYKLGCVSMIRRTVDMIRTGLLEVEKTGSTYVFKKTAVMDLQFLDTMEFGYLSDMEKDVKKNLHQQLDGWNIMDQDELLEDMFRPGNFFSHQKSEFKAFLLDDIDKRMEPLVNPWHSGHGIMMAYGSTEEIDFHFLAIATEIVRSWREDAGFSPETKIKK